MTQYASVADIESAFLALKAQYKKYPYPELNERKATLKTLKASLIEHEQAFYDALSADYGYRSEFDSLIADVLPTVMGANYSLKHLKKWMKPSRRHTGLMLFPSRVAVHYQPLGVVGIIVPWNFPLLLALSPAIQALAAGNRVMLKLSEFTPKTNQVLRDATKCIAEHLSIIEGESEAGAAFSKLPFDHLVFTGSTAVGRHVATAAAANLTPTTLELGGKSPAIIAEDANWESAVDAIVLGKALNAGQICVSPDYVMVPSGTKDKFIELFKQRYNAYFEGKNKHSVNRQSHIVNERQHNRLLKILSDAGDKGAVAHQVTEGVQFGDDFYFPPILLTHLKKDMLVMQEEIFGPILPVIEYKTFDHCIHFINNRPRPLALYLMTKSPDTRAFFLQNTHSGGVCINDAVVHVSAEDAPFGGIGDSGLGHYHGKEGFERLSKAKTVVVSPAWLPRNQWLLRYRDFMFKALRWVFLR